MEITLDSKFVQYLELRNRALNKRESAALYQLAQVYSHMNDKKAKRKAYELYKISAAFGYAEAQFMMGVCCENGTGTRRSEQMAIMWYLRAEISAASDIADHSEFVEEAERKRLHLYHEDPYRNFLFSYSYVLRNFGMAGSTADHRCQGIGFASLRVLDSDALLRRQVIKAAMPPFANEN